MALYRKDRKMPVHLTFKKSSISMGTSVRPGDRRESVPIYSEPYFIKRIPDHKISIIAENSTSALDAIQIILGLTIGNQRLQIMDFGKHNYTIIGKNAFCSVCAYM